MSKQGDIDLATSAFNIPDAVELLVAIDSVASCPSGLCDMSKAAVARPLADVEDLVIPGVDQSIDVAANLLGDTGLELIHCAAER